MKLPLILGIVLCTTVAAARPPFVTVVTGSGTASEPDRGQADSEALTEAESNANGLCVGTVIGSTKVSDTCFSVGDQDNPQYICNVMVQVRCQL